MICPDCGATFAPTDPRQVFCKPGHMKRFYNLAMKRGGVLLPLAQVWRRGKRGRTKATAYALNTMAALLDQWAAEDMLAGRDPSFIVGRKMGAGWSAADLSARKARGG